MKVVNTGNLESWRTISGQIKDLSDKMDIYLIYKGNQSAKLNLNWFRFSHASTSISSRQNKGNAISCYPNPTNGMVYFTFPEKIENATINIYNTAGKIVKSKIVIANSISVDELDAGLYCYTVEDPKRNKEYHGKFLLK